MPDIPKRGSEKMDIPIIGQEAVCPDGLGRVVSFDTVDTVGIVISKIKVRTYIDDRSCNWDACNVELIKIRKG